MNTAATISAIANRRSAVPMSCVPAARISEQDRVVHDRAIGGPVADHAWIAEIHRWASRRSAESGRALRKSAERDGASLGPARSPDRARTAARKKSFEFNDDVPRFAADDIGASRW